MTHRHIDQKVAVAVVFVMAMFMNIMDITIVNVALPQIGRDFDVKPTAVSAISIGYLVSLAVVIPASGWLGDRFGTKRILLTAIVIFTAASMLCGAAPNFGLLVAARVLQGVGGGMLTPVGMAMLFRAYPPEERVRASSILATPTALAPAIGPVLGGILVTSLSWRWVFFVNLPIGLIALIFGILFLDEQELQDTGTFDVTGFILSGIGFAALMYGISEGPQRGWGSTVIIVALIAGIALLCALLRQQLRNPDPLLKLQLFTDRLFRSSTALIFLGMGAFLGTLYLSSLFFQDALGLSALKSGLSTFPEAIGIMIGAQIASRILYPRFGPRRLMGCGLVGVAVMIGLMSLIDNRDELWWMRLLMLSLGISMAPVFVSTQAAALARISRQDTGRASTLFNALRQLGGAAGVAVLTTSLTLASNSHAIHGAASVHAFHVAFLVAAGIALLASALTFTVHDEDAASTRQPRTKQPAAQPV